ncbi:hypothetical protein PIROE2DRAFT_65492, partial [Piromyces sp. E2]
IYYYIITQRFITEVKQKELKDFEEARIREEGRIVVVEIDENRTVINGDDNDQDGNGQDEATVINDGDNDNDNESLEVTVEDAEQQVRRISDIPTVEIVNRNETSNTPGC